jgi:CheY-like chemotaxis protein
LTIIDDILDFSKMEAHKLTLRPVPMSVRDCISQTLLALSARGREKNLSLEQEVESIIPEQLVGDPTRLRQILINLIGNAIKFTSSGRVRVSAKWLERSSTGMRLEFCVEDTGPGIPKNQQNLIFEAFRQADGSYTREFGGTGLGLTISSQLVGLMDGRIWVESELGQGSRFYFTANFGLVPSDLRVSVKKATPGVADGNSETNSTQRLRILVVEDNLVNQRLAQTLLQKKGHQVTVAGNGRIAIEKLQECDWQVDVVLMDVQMPEMDGLECTRYIRDNYNRQPVIIAMTANAMIEDREECIKAGMNNYIPKPVKIEILNVMLQETEFPAKVIA